MNHNTELEQLIQQYIDGRISAEDLHQLNENLADDPDARKRFNELLNLDSALAAITAGEQLEDDLCEVSPEIQKKTKIKTGFPAAFWLLCTIATLVLLIGGMQWWRADRQIYATVSSAAGVEEYPEGSMLSRQTVTIEKGSLEFITIKGATIVVEAPATFRFESAQQLHLMNGRLAADVPPAAKGFTVVTPAGKAVDLGTKFGVDVPALGDAEIHVFQGEVIAQSSGGGKRQSLKDGEAFLLQSGAGIHRWLRSSAFIRPGEVASLRAALAKGQQAKSDAAIAKLRNDPALIALLDFESDELPEGVYRMGQGRWPGSRAPEFVNVGDHMKIDVGGTREWPQLTLAAWVRLDQLGEPFQSLLHTDGWGEQDGQVHWMVTHHSTMRLALYGNRLVSDSTNKDRYPDSLTPVLPQQGRWVHLVVVYDSIAGTVRFYFNGKFDKEERLQITHPARLGPGQIGNWDMSDRKLSGRMDELLILGRTMSDREVQALFDVGTPYH